MDYWTQQDAWIADQNNARRYGEHELTFEEWIKGALAMRPTKATRIALAVALRDLREAA